MHSRLTILRRITQTYWYREYKGVADIKLLTFVMRVDHSMADVTERQ